MDMDVYFKKQQLVPENILYICREDKRTVIHRADGSTCTSLIPVHEFTEFLSDKDFLSIAKGVLVRRSSIASISHDGIYTMSDGQTFQGRKRNMSAHRRLSREMQISAPAQSTVARMSMDFSERCSVLDDMPVAYCVIELVFDEKGHGVDFVFRYCNKEMATVEGVSVEAMLNHSFYEVFKNGDRKWLVAYADVALNGTRRTIHDFSPEIGKNLTIHCYQPKPGFCACVLLPDE